MQPQRGQERAQWEPQTPQASTRQTTSPGPATGSGSSSARRSSSAAGTPCALVELDVDRFKTLNDLYGHLVGDQLLSREPAGNQFQWQDIIYIKWIQERKFKLVQ